MAEHKGPRIIAFTGPKTSGKDTMASILFRQNWNHARKYVPIFKRTPFASGVKSICSSTFGWSMAEQDDPVFKETVLESWPNIMPRWALMDIANFMRDKYGPDVWVHALNRHIESLEKNDPHGAYVITDLRFPNEIAWLKNMGALIIYVHRTEAEEALAEAQERGDEAALNPSEMHYPLMRESADLVLSNDAEIHKGQAQVMNMIRQRFDHWTYWGMGAFKREGEEK